MVEFGSGLLWALIPLFLSVFIAIFATSYSTEISDNNRHILIPILSFIAGFLASSILAIAIFTLLNL